MSFSKSIYDPATEQRLSQSAQFNDGTFHNAASTRVWEFGKMWTAIKEYASKRIDPTPKKDIPIQTIHRDEFYDAQSDALRFSKLGHSTLLIQLGQQVWLTDPVFSKRASPVQWAGPKRFHPVPVELQDLPEIEGVIISHNHYDHLDHGSIQLLKDKVNHFLVPLGIGLTLEKWGVAKEKITELDWWQSKHINGTEIIATPAQHFSGRGVFDGDKTLWASWVIRNAQHSVFFSGDTGYFDGFKEIGKQFGPFDMAFVENGAYHHSWRNIHMMPEDSLQAFKDLNARLLIPIHNGTFDLSTHSWYDPMNKISALAQRDNIEYLIPFFGQIVDTKQLPPQVEWWLEPETHQQRETRLAMMTAD